MLLRLNRAMKTLGNIIRKLRTEKGMTQGELAKAAGMKQSDISKLELGTTQETTGIVRIAMALGVSPIYLETLDDRYAELTAFEPAPPSTSHSLKNNLDVYVPITNATAAMGGGYHQQEADAVVDVVRVTKSWVKTELPYLSSVDNLALITAIGDSMEPTFKSGDLLLVDRGVLTIDGSSSIYIFSYGGLMFVKRLHLNPVTKVIHVRSDNQYADSWEVDEKHRDELSILGRVIYAWNSKRL